MFVNVGTISAPSGSTSWRDATENEPLFFFSKCTFTETFSPIKQETRQLRNKLWLETSAGPVNVPRLSSADLSSAQGSNVSTAAVELVWIQGLDPVRDYAVPSTNR